MRLGEDRAFYQALRRMDARIVHARDVRVVVSGRILGRADGGMADTIRRRLAAPDTMLDDALEPVALRVRRIELRKAAREAFATRPGRCSGYFGDAWAKLDGMVPTVRVPVADLPAQMRAGFAIRKRLYARQSVSHAV